MPSDDCAEIREEIEALLKRAKVLGLTSDEAGQLFIAITDRNLNVGWPRAPRLSGLGQLLVTAMKEADSKYPEDVPGLEALIRERLEVKGL